MYTIVYFGVFYNSRNHANPHFRAVSYFYYAILAFFLSGLLRRRFANRVRVLIKLASARCTPFKLSEPRPEARCYPTEHTDQGLRLRVPHWHDRAPGRHCQLELPGASIAGIHEPFGSTPWRAAAMFKFGSTIQYGAHQHPRYSPYALSTHYNSVPRASDVRVPGRVR